MEESLLEEVELLLVLFSLLNMDWAEAFVAQKAQAHTNITFRIVFFISLFLWFTLLFSYKFHHSSGLYKCRVEDY